MQRIFSFRQGDRSEYLAQYILSSFAISVPVPRQEDVGGDFHCSLLRRDGDYLRPYLPFNIQIKSHSPELIRNGVPFGGITQGGQWRQHEIEQLCQIDTPFLVGLVNKDEQWMDLFTTIPRYFVRVNWTGRPPRTVVLLPYQPCGENHLGAGADEELAALEGMPNRLWKLPIGQPINRISITDAEDRERCEVIKRTLEPFLYLDQENAVLARLGLGYFQWPLIMRRELPPHEIGVGYAVGPPGSPPFERQLITLSKLIASVIQSYRGTDQRDPIRTWLPVIDQLPLDRLDPLTRNILEQAAAYANRPADSNA